MNNLEGQLGREPTRLERLAGRAGVLLGLLYLVVEASDLADSSLSTARIAAISVGLGVFVAVYWSLLPPIRWLRSRDEVWTIGALALLPAIAGVLLLAGAPSSFTALFIYVVAAAGILLPPRLALAVIFLTALGVGLGTAATGSSGGTVATWVLTIVSIGTIMAGFGWIIRANRELQAARVELARLAVTEERLRIARDLHDLLGHSLSLIALKTELAARFVHRDADRAAAELTDIENVTRQALAEVRGAVQGYRKLGLDEALDGARVALAAAGIDYQLEESPLAVPPDVEAVLAWAVREGTTNVVRHSHADHCDIRVEARAGLAAVEVEDDGDVAPAAAPAGSGLAGLAERARAVHGTLEAGPRSEGGFRLRLTVPLIEP
jgi:two-component system sensor histidine kinase DesK